RRPPGPRSSESENTSPQPTVTPTSPGTSCSTGSSSISTSCSGASATLRSPAPLPEPRGSASQRRREHSHPARSVALAADAGWWRTMRFAIRCSAARLFGGSNEAASRSRHGVVRSHARSTTHAEPGAVSGLLVAHYRAGVELLPSFLDGAQNRAGGVVSAEPLQSVGDLPLPVTIHDHHEVEHTRWGQRLVGGVSFAQHLAQRR